MFTHHDPGQGGKHELHVLLVWSRSHFVLTVPRAHCDSHFGGGVGWGGVAVLLSHRGLTDFY